VTRPGSPKPDPIGFARLKKTTGKPGKPAGTPDGSVCPGFLGPVTGHISNRVGPVGPGTGRTRPVPTCLFGEPWSRLRFENVREDVRAAFESARMHACIDEYIYVVSRHHDSSDRHDSWAATDCEPGPSQSSALLRSVVHTRSRSIVHAHVVRIGLL
jgi:hypothetical protein